MFFRARADLFVLHSHREVRAYEQLAGENGVTPHFALATLPFARRWPQASTVRRDSVVFAAQPSVPAERADRERIVGWLVEAARAHPEWRVVVKVRAAAGEHQTHREQTRTRSSSPTTRRRTSSSRVGRWRTTSTVRWHSVTVSSTAVLEAAARGVPALTLTDFGVGRPLINEVFVGSGLEGDARDLVDGRFGTVDPAWMHDNHFHPESDDDWVARTEVLMAQRDAGSWSTDRPPDGAAGRVATCLGTAERARIGGSVRARSRRAGARHAGPDGEAGRATDQTARVAGAGAAPAAGAPRFAAGACADGSRRRDRPDALDPRRRRADPMRRR